MPIYEFECTKHGVFEKLVPIRLYEQLKEGGITCYQSIITKESYTICTEICYMVWSIPATVQIAAPTIAFVNPQTGKAIIATSRHEQPPEGFIKQELKSSIERTKFENVQNAINSQEDAIYNEDIRQKRSEFKKNHIDLIRQNMSRDVADSDNPSATEALMKDAIEHIQKKPLLKKKRKTEFTLSVNHLDKSNLD